jgi:hypothetical protein
MPPGGISGCVSHSAEMPLGSVMQDVGGMEPYFVEEAEHSTPVPDTPPRDSTVPVKPPLGDPSMPWDNSDTSYTAFNTPSYDSSPTSTVFAIDPAVTESAYQACQSRYNGNRPIPLYDGLGKPACCGPIKDYLENGQVDECPPARRT